MIIKPSNFSKMDYSKEMKENEIMSLQNYFKEHGGIIEGHANDNGVEEEDIDEYDYNDSNNPHKYNISYRPVTYTMTKENESQYQMEEKSKCRSLRYLKEILRRNTLPLNYSILPETTLLRELKQHNYNCCNPNNALMKPKHCRQLQKTLHNVQGDIKLPVKRCEKDDILSLYRVKPNPHMQHEKDDQYVLDIPLTLERFKNKKHDCCRNWFYNKNPICKQIKRETKRLKAELRRQTRKQKGSRWWWYGGKKNKTLKTMK